MIYTLNAQRLHNSSNIKIAKSKDILFYDNLLFQSHYYRNRIILMIINVVFFVPCTNAISNTSFEVMFISKLCLSIVGSYIMFLHGYLLVKGRSAVWTIAFKFVAGKRKATQNNQCLIVIVSDNILNGQL